MLGLGHRRTSSGAVGRRKRRSTTPARSSRPRRARTAPSTRGTRGTRRGPDGARRTTRTPTNPGAIISGRRVTPSTVDGPSRIERRLQLDHGRPVRLAPRRRTARRRAARTTSPRYPAGVVGSSPGPSVGSAPGAPANASVGNRPCERQVGAEERRHPQAEVRPVDGDGRDRVDDREVADVPRRPQHPPAGGRRPDRARGRGHVRPAGPPSARRTCRPARRRARRTGSPRSTSATTWGG